MNKQRYEQGGVVTFLVVALVLAGLLVGGMMLVKKQSSQSRSNTNAPTEQTVTVDGEASEGAATTESGGAGASNGPAAGGAQASDSESAATSGNSGGNSESTSGSGSSAGIGGAGPSETTAEGSPSVATLPNSGPSDIQEIPSTGPTENIVAVIVLALLSGGVYMYVRSTRQLRANALK